MHQYMSAQKVVQEHVRNSREFAERLVSAVGKEGAAGKVGQSVTQVIASLTQMAVSKRFEGILEDGDVGSKELDRLARIARNPSAAGRQDVSRERELAEFMKTQASTLDNAVAKNRIDEKACE